LSRDTESLLSADGGRHVLPRSPMSRVEHCRRRGCRPPLHGPWSRDLRGGFPVSVSTGTLGGSTELHRVGFPGVLASAIRSDANSPNDTPEDAKRDQRGCLLQSERCRATTISGVGAAPDGQTVRCPRRQGVDQHRKSRPSRSLLRQPDGSRLGPIGRHQGRHSAHPSMPAPTAPPRT